MNDIDPAKQRITDESYVRRTLQRYFWFLCSGLAGILVLSVLLNILLAWAIVARFPIKQFIWTADAAAVCEATPLNEPNISPARLKDLAATAAVQLNTFDYANWRVLINASLERFFTQHGREQYRQVLTSTGIIQRVVDQYQVVSAITIAPPNIAREGHNAGRYYWIIEVPVTIFYQTNVESKRENRLLTMTVIRVDPSPLNPNGIAIDAITSTQLLASQLQQIQGTR